MQEKMEFQLYCNSYHFLDTTLVFTTEIFRSEDSSSSSKEIKYLATIKKRRCDVS